MPALSLSDRRNLADRIRARRADVSIAVSDDYFIAHPEWHARFGDAGKERCREDACFHIDFLAGAIEAGSDGPFRDYARWTARMLNARKIPPECLRENFASLRTNLARGLPADEAALVDSIVDAGANAVEDPRAMAVADDFNADILAARPLFLRAILHGERKAATGIALESLSAAKRVLEVYVGVFQEALYEVGRLWESNQITVAEEHMATAVTQYVISQAYTHIPVSKARRGKLVMTGVSGELHQVGAHMVSDVLEAEGYDVRFLGTNLPHSGIVAAVSEHKADVVGISVTMLFNIPQAIRLVADLRASLGDRMPRIVVGGAAFRSAPELARELGAEGVGVDLRAARTLLC